MDTPVEFNTVLALRAYGAGDEFSEDQCIPEEEEIEFHSQHEFCKRGYRIFELNKLLPLVVTEGDRKFTRVVGLVVIEHICIDKDPMSRVLEEKDPGYYTTGTYRILRIFNEKESDYWLKLIACEGI